MYDIEKESELRLLLHCIYKKDNAIILHCLIVSAFLCHLFVIAYS